MSIYQLRRVTWWTRHDKEYPDPDTEDEVEEEEEQKEEAKIEDDKIADPDPTSRNIDLVFSKLCHYIRKYLLFLFFVEQKHNVLFEQKSHFRLTHKTRNTILNDLVVQCRLSIQVHLMLFLT